MKKLSLLYSVLFLALTGCQTEQTLKVEVDTDKPNVLGTIDYKLDNMGRTRSEYHFSEDGSLIVDLEIDKTALKTGDIVYFQTPEFEGFPDNPNLKLADNNISRIIAVPGDTVEIKEGKVFVNDKKLVAFYGEAARFGFTKDEYVKFKQINEPNYKLSEQEEDYFNQSMPKTKIPKDHIFIIGDNWSRSVDSRHFGPVPYENVKGLVLGVNKQAK